MGAFDRRNEGILFGESQKPEFKITRLCKSVLNFSDQRFVLHNDYCFAFALISRGTCPCVVVLSVEGRVTVEASSVPIQLCHLVFPQNVWFRNEVPLLESHLTPLVPETHYKISYTFGACLCTESYLDGLVLSSTL